MRHPHALRILAALALMLVGWIAAKALHLTPTKRAPSWTGITVIRQAAGEDALLTQAITDVIDAGVRPIFGAEAIGTLIRHVHAELSQHRAARLCLPMVVDGVAAASTALWSSRDAARLLIALQRELDADGGIAFPYLQRVLALVREGSTAGEILTSDGHLAGPRTRPS